MQLKSQQIKQEQLLLMQIPCSRGNHGFIPIQRQKLKKAGPGIPEPPPGHQESQPPTKRTQLTIPGRGYTRHSTPGGKSEEFGNRRGGNKTESQQQPPGGEGARGRRPLPPGPPPPPLKTQNKNLRRGIRTDTLQQNEWIVVG